MANSADVPALKCNGLASRKAFIQQSSGADYIDGVTVEYKATVVVRACIIENVLTIIVMCTVSKDSTAPVLTFCS